MKKIEGWVSSAAFTDPCNSGCSFCQHMRPLLADQKATLVIGDERVFTESEVRAKDEDLKWALNWINNEAKHLREMGQPQKALEVALDMILERHGIVLDPQ